MSKAEFIKRAFDASALIYNNGTSAEGLRINPVVWDARLREFQEKLLVVAPLAEQFDFTGPGSDLKVTIDERPSAAAALVETDTVSVSAFVTRQVTFSPVEYGTKYELSYAEAARSFFDVQERMMRKMGYALAEKKDALAWSTLIAGATTTVWSNSKTATSSLATTDLLNLGDVTRGIRAIENLYYVPDSLIISPTHKQNLMVDTSIVKLLDASQFGTRSAIANGLVGELMGLRVFVSHAPAITSNALDCLVLGRTRSGEGAFGLGTKRRVQMEADRDISFRKIEVVATEEYQFKVLHAGALCVIKTYA
jgi:hypothetical protein